MATKSARSIRIRGLPPETTEHNLEDIAASLLKCEAISLDSVRINLRVDESY
jgi:hypothetical protein